jgi:hypothetical protein
MTRNTIVASINGVDTPNVDVCADVLSKIPDGAYFTLAMRHVIDQRYFYKDVVIMDRRFFSMAMYSRDMLADITRDEIMSNVWTRVEFPTPPPPQPRGDEPLTAPNEVRSSSWRHLSPAFELGMSSGTLHVHSQCSPLTHSSFLPCSLPH